MLCCGEYLGTDWVKYDACRSWMAAGGTALAMLATRLPPGLMLHRRVGRQQVSTSYSTTHNAYCCVSTSHTSNTNQQTHPISDNGLVHACP